MAKMTHQEQLSKAIEAMIDDYEVMCKNDMAAQDTSLEDDEQGDAIAPGDTKGGLNPAGGGQGALNSAVGNDPTSIGAEIKVPGPKAPKQRGDGMGQDSTAMGIEIKVPTMQAGSGPGDGMGTSAVVQDGKVQKAEGSAPPGFKAKEEKNSAGAEDEATERDAEDEGEEAQDHGEESEDQEHDEDGEEDPEHGEESGDEDEDGQFGGGQEGEEGDEDPAMEAAVEKALYKFMAKIGMGGGEMGKSEGSGLEDLDPMTLEPRIQAAESLAKSQSESLAKSMGEELAKRDSQIADLVQVVKGLQETLAKFAKAPASKPRSLEAYQPMTKSEVGADAGSVATEMSKAALIDRALVLQKSGALKDRTVVTKMSLAPPHIAHQLAAAAGIQ